MDRPQRHLFTALFSTKTITALLKAYQTISYVLLIDGTPLSEYENKRRKIVVDFDAFYLFTFPMEHAYFCLI